MAVAVRLPKPFEEDDAAFAPTGPGPGPKGTSAPAAAGFSKLGPTRRPVPSASEFATEPTPPPLFGGESSSLPTPTPTISGYSPTAQSILGAMSMVSPGFPAAVPTIPGVGTAISAGMKALGVPPAVQSGIDLGFNALSGISPYGAMKGLAQLFSDVGWLAPATANISSLTPAGQAEFGKAITAMDPEIALAVLADPANSPLAGQIGVNFNQSIPMTPAIRAGVFTSPGKTVETNPFDARYGLQIPIPDPNPTPTPSPNVDVPDPNQGLYSGVDVPGPYSGLYSGMGLGDPSTGPPAGPPTGPPTGDPSDGGLGPPGGPGPAPGDSSDAGGDAGVGAFHSGGYVEGPDPSRSGEDVPAVLQEGEYVVPRGAGRGRFARPGFAGLSKITLHFK